MQRQPGLGAASRTSEPGLGATSRTSDSLRWVLRAMLTGSVPARASWQLLPSWFSVLAQDGVSGFDTLERYLRPLNRCKRV